MVMDAIQKAEPGIDLRLVTMKTSGDKLADAPLAAAGGKGLFVKELDRALADGEVDLTVHSYKDLPLETPPDLPVVCVSERADVRDVLVLPVDAPVPSSGVTGMRGDGTWVLPQTQADAQKPAAHGLRQADACPHTPLAGAQPQSAAGASKPIGCASGRRACQLGALFPGVPVAPVRGNVQTRLAKLDAGQYAALVLAAAGLARLGLSARVSRFFTVDELVPAACQGILAVQARAGEDVSCLRGFHSPEAWDASRAERAFVRTLGGGCGTPVAAYAEVNGAELLLRGLFLHEASGRVLRGRLAGERTRAEKIGEMLAQRLAAQAQEL